MARQDENPETEPSTDPRQSEAERKRRFANALARAEFGRFYWNDELESRLQGALVPPGNGARKRPRRGG
ncbi:hypothetical protein G3545_08110 [Starkeya sp. ORNL1]|uniref:hypothetical protein n=1 Tax=Starkeya sp. ORNL1 TaxID=2709380 RepID=UPI0014644EAF|nr:hypothetical protein [Starkeya sp. ORNL1]QJP13625.1 hypothetical protein G3545_08110 [Starkeya sp. ORNL1]